MGGQPLAGGAAGQVAENREIDGGRQSVHAAVAKDELADARMIAAKQPRFTVDIVRERRDQWRVRTGGPACGRGVVAVIDGAVQPADAEVTHGHVLFTRHHSTTQPVVHLTKTNPSPPELK